jgi:GGDEF domain-containing protein
MAEPPFGARRPRPVADVPPPALADGEAAAKGWLLALLARRPLGEAGGVPVAELAREGPELCAATLRAVGSDAALDELRGGRLAARAGELAGAGDAPAIAAAVAALRTALWEALLVAMAPLDQPTTAALAERLAWVCDLVAAPGLEATAAERPAAFRVHDARRPHLVEVRGPSWRDALRRALERHARDGAPVALLALEVDDAARLLAADRDGAAADALAGAERAVRDALAPGDVLGRDGNGRLWIVAHGLGAAEATALGRRLADAVAAVGPLRGAPLTVSIGAASCPPEAPDLEALAALADERLFAARAAGVPIA